MSSRLIRPLIGRDAATLSFPEVRRLWSWCGALVWSYGAPPPWCRL